MKIRESNFELLRITAMMMVVLLHCNYFIFGAVLQPEISANPLSAFGRLFADQICTPCVNLFILISGWFGIRPKIKGGLSILFQVAFYTLISIGVCYLMKWDISFDKIKAALTCQQAYWFIWPYLLLYITAPAFNLLVEKESKKTVLVIILSLLVFEFTLDWIVYYAGGHGGKSYIAFVTLYLIARMLAKYKDDYKAYKGYVYFILFLLFTIMPTVLAFFGEQFIKFQFGKSAYTNPFVIAASVSLLLCFSTMSFKSRGINWLACSAFSIYLFHMNPLLSKHFHDILQALFNMVGGWYTPLVIASSFILGLLCMLFDKTRILLWGMIVKDH